MEKKKNIMIVVIVVLLFGVMTSIAYFSNDFDFLTGFTSEPFNNSVKEKFVSPKNWKPGDITEKTLIATNHNNYDVVVRLSYTEEWKSDNGDTLSNIVGNNKMAIVNLDNRSDWIKYNGYYYYNGVLSKNQSTSSFMKSVIFNKNAIVDDTCEENEEGTEITCTSSGNGYDNATYTLAFNIEFAQYEAYKETWNTDFEIGGYYPNILADYLVEKAYPSELIEEPYDTKEEMHTYNQPLTDSTPALTEYRYIGDEPNNYIYFNCTDENDTSTCEVWRIIGVFSVEDQFGNYKQRVKIIRGEPKESASYLELKNKTYYETLNSGSYWNSLSDNAKIMIGTSKFYYGIPNTLYSCMASGKVSGDNFYIGERTSRSYDYYLIDKIGLLTLSDYFYSYYYNSNDSQNHSWIYDSNKYSYIYSNFVMNINNSNVPYYTSNTCTYTQNYGDYPVRPSLYLFETTEYVSGDGKIDNPYQIKIKSFNISIPNSELYSAPESAAIGTSVTININDNYEILSFKLNGNLVTGNSFIMPNKDVNITDVQYKKIKYNITNTDSDAIVPEIAHIGDTIVIDSDNYEILSFKMNGNLIEGNSFVMPEEDVEITDISKKELIVVQSTHYPYPANQNYTQYYENTFEGATSIRVDIKYQLSYDYVRIYNSSTASNYSYVKSFGGNSYKQIYTDSYVLSGNYIKIKFSSSSSSKDGLYGFRAIITPIYE